MGKEAKLQLYFARPAAMSCQSERGKPLVCGVKPLITGAMVLLMYTVMTVIISLFFNLGMYVEGN